ncbi:MAG: argininosuccinate synthase [Treponema sp.]|nr:argininosuccinate synthase [Treponema sp.]
MKKKVVLAYSGGLDTTVCIPWLIENQDCEVIAVCVDIGQTADWKDITKRAAKAGASICHIADMKKEYVEEYIWQTLKAGAVYEDKYLLGASTARALITKVLVEFARKEKATAIAHGATGKGNDQVRLDLGIMALAPDLEIIAPWRIWKLKTRQDQVRYLSRRNLPLPQKKKNSYSIDDSLWHVSHEGLDLEDPANEPSYRKLLSMTVTPEKAPNSPVYVEIEFENGIPVGLNGKKMEGLALINSLNKIGGANGIGITDLIENRVIGIKCRGVYEAPGAAILYYAHKQLEHLCLDRQTFVFKQQTSIKMGEMIYNGHWHSPLRQALSSFVDVTQQVVNGKVKLKLYKGSISAAGITSPNSLYNSNLASFTTGEHYSLADAKGFVKLYALPVLVRSLSHNGKKNSVKSSASASAAKPKSASGKKKTSKK